MATEKFDAETRKWFVRHIGAETTVQQCEKCGLYYKPILGHKCKAKESSLLFADMEEIIDA